MKAYKSKISRAQVLHNKNLDGAVKWIRIKSFVERNNHLGLNSNYKSLFLWIEIQKNL